MHKDYPPFQLFSPEIAPRRKEKSGGPSYAPEVLQRRQEIARTLLAQINPLSNELRQLSDEERKAVFFKLEHERPIKLDGTDLKPVAEPTANITLAVPRSDNLNKLAAKVEAFGDSEIQNRAGRDHVKNEGLVVPLKTIAQGSATDRLSQPLFDEYRNLVKRKWVIFEIEIIALLVLRNFS